MKWVSDDGLVEVERDGQAGDVTARVPGHERIVLAARWGSRRWIVVIEPEDDDGTDYLMVAIDRDDMIVALANVRPHAAATEDDPRVLEREWRCARVIEEQSE